MSFTIPILSPERPEYPALPAVLAALTLQEDEGWWGRYLQAEDPALKFTQDGVSGLTGAVRHRLAPWSAGYAEALEVLAGRELIPSPWMQAHPFWSPEGTPGLPQPESPEMSVLVAVASLGAPALATLQALVTETANRYRAHGLEAPDTVFWDVSEEPVPPGFLLKTGNFLVDLSGVETLSEAESIFGGKARIATLTNPYELLPTVQRRAIGPLGRAVRLGVKVVEVASRGYTLRLPPP